MPEEPKPPLRGGRQRSDHIQTHRIELGVWERERLKRYEAVVFWGGIAPVAAGVLAVGAGAGLAAWAVYKWGEAVTGFVDEAGGAFANAAKWGFLNLTPLGPVWRLWEATQDN